MTNQCINDPRSLSRDAPYHRDCSGNYCPVLFYDIHYGAEVHDQHSVKNMDEVKFIVGLYASFSSKYPKYSANVGIIAPYRAQRMALVEAFRARFGNGYQSKIEISTVDGFQGIVFVFW
mgnify:CR=1 FL=1